MVLASSNFFRYPLIFGIKTQNGATFSLLFYPTKYLEPFFAQGNSSDITIVSIFTSPVVTAFFRRMKLVSQFQYHQISGNFCLSYIHTRKKNIPLSAPGRSISHY